MMDSELQLFKPKYRTEECLELLREVLDSGWTAPGSMTQRFEREWCEYTALPRAHFLNSATAGLHLALEVLRLKYDWLKGYEVITTPLTFVSTNHSIAQAGFKPLFADVTDDLCLDPRSVEKLIGHNTVAVMFVGMGGNPGHLKEISALCRDRGLKLILDAAHMAGTRLDGAHVGREADVTVFSFQTVKNLPTGDGGMICFADEKLDAIARKLAWCGIDKDTYARSAAGEYRWMYHVPFMGWKYQGNAIAAALGIVALRHLDEDNAHRRRLAALYEKEFGAFFSVKRFGTRLPAAIQCIEMAPGSESSRHLFQVIMRNTQVRDLAIERLIERRIYPGVHYRLNTDYPMYSYHKNWTGFAQDVASRLLSLPLHCYMEESDVTKVVAALEFLPP